jgi:hypothetical protein
LGDQSFPAVRPLAEKNGFREVLRVHRWQNESIGTGDLRRIDVRLGPSAWVVSVEKSKSLIENRRKARLEAGRDLRNILGSLDHTASRVVSDLSRQGLTSGSNSESSGIERRSVLVCCTARPGARVEPLRECVHPQDLPIYSFENTTIDDDSRLLQTVRIGWLFEFPLRERE